MSNPDRLPESYVHAIARSGLSIYDPIEVGDPELWIPANVLETILHSKLLGCSFHGLALRTRSKVAKEKVCRALGYPVPRSFRKTQPRFVGQRFDTYVQKSDNLQVWNEELSPTRRYVIIRLDEDDEVSRVKVVTGEVLAMLDTTGTLTQKFQASIVPTDATCELISATDTTNIKPLVSRDVDVGCALPTDYAASGDLMPIGQLFEMLSPLVGQRFPDPGRTQERNRGADLHRIVCEALGYAQYADAGDFPDVRHQLLEVKLQTSPTIDLGLVCPDSEDPLDGPQIADRQIRHCDVRYAVFYGTTDGVNVELTNFYLSTGESFFTRFRQFQGKVLNKKLQIPLPSDFFT